ncbi:hypothetical protein AC578_8712 [Pseudocercospora eumusae]|uniref:F-box domain-containing protein n=1 Tax=Pseudocercospora eumusae TaxID=321146 RepID=A0A139HPR8_9PEZI|nr:hypothetical protein AC578_8712 [Pseudocercospora eumusae]
MADFLTVPKLTSSLATFISDIVKSAMASSSRAPSVRDLKPLPEVNLADSLADGCGSLSLETAEVEARKQKQRSAAQDKEEASFLPPFAAKVFAIFELAEQILEHVRPQDLFIWKRVNTAFRDVIKESTRLQNPMHITAACGEGSWPFDHTDRVKQDWHRPYPKLKQGELEIPSIYDAPEPEDNTEYTWKSLPVAKPPVKRVTMFVHKSCFTLVHTKELKQDGGVTVGDLVTAATRYIAPIRQYQLPYRYRFVLRNE